VVVNGGAALPKEWTIRTRLASAPSAPMVARAASNTPEAALKMNRRKNPLPRTRPEKWLLVFTLPAPRIPRHLEPLQDPRLDRQTATPPPGNSTALNSNVHKISVYNCNPRLLTGIGTQNHRQIRRQVPAGELLAAIRRIFEIFGGLPRRCPTPLARIRGMKMKILKCKLENRVPCRPGNSRSSAFAASKLSRQCCPSHGRRAHSASRPVQLSPTWSRLQLTFQSRLVQPGSNLPVQAG
jgi:hypothetical protein